MVENAQDDTATNNHTITKTVTKLSPEKTESETNGIKPDISSVPPVTNNRLSPNNKDMKPVIDSVKTDNKQVKKENKATDGNTDDDGFAGLDWKDGIASLPGIYPFLSYFKEGSLKINESIKESIKESINQHITDEFICNNNENHYMKFATYSAVWCISRYYSDRPGLVFL